MEQPPPPEAPQAVAPVPAFQQGRYSPDGFWWWDGANWRPAYSEDRLWRWNGQTWVPTAAPPPGSGGGAGLAIGLGIGMFVLVFFVVAVLVTMGGQIANVFSNVVAVLGSPAPSPSP